jgi:hypothetical protein
MRDAFGVLRQVRQKRSLPEARPDGQHTSGGARRAPFAPCGRRSPHAHGDPPGRLAPGSCPGHAHRCSRTRGTCPQPAVLAPLSHGGGVLTAERLRQASGAAPLWSDRLAAAGGPGPPGRCDPTCGPMGGSTGGAPCAADQGCAPVSGLCAGRVCAVCDGGAVAAVGERGVGQGPGRGGVGPSGRAARQGAAPRRSPGTPAPRGATAGAVGGGGLADGG